MTGPDVTVVMPVRNGARHLQQAVRSILDQSMIRFECLIVDDGSDDDTPKMIAALSDSDDRIRVLRQPPRGLVAALNLALDAAQASLIARMDADDVAYPQRLARQCAYLAAHPEIALVGSSFDVIDEAGRFRRRVQPPSSPAAIRQALTAGNCIAHPTVMFRSHVVRALGGYRAQFVQAEDYDLWLRMAETHDLATIDEPLLCYRDHAAQVSWRNHEQRILSQLLAQASATLRKAGQPDPAAGIALASRDALYAAGWNATSIARAVASRAVDTARDATSAGHRSAARSAIRLALGEPHLPARSRLRCLAEWLRVELLCAARDGRLHAAPTRPISTREEPT